MAPAESGSPANKAKRGKRKQNRDDAPAGPPSEGLSIEELVRRRQRGEATAPATASPADDLKPGECASPDDENNARPQTARGGRPSLGELQSRTNGWDCPRCGCRDWRVINSYLCADGTRHRRQYCRHCLFSRLTVEAPADSD